MPCLLIGGIRLRPEESYLITKLLLKKKSKETRIIFKCMDMYGQHKNVFKTYVDDSAYVVMSISLR